MKKYLTLFLTMLKIGLFTFGGGYAMLALLENEFITKRKWIEHEEFMDMLAIAESTPGPIAINSATYIGYKRGGVLGSIACTTGVCIPSIVIIFLISLFFDSFLSVAWVAAAFRGIQACVVFLILSAGLKLLKKLPKTVFSLTVFGVTLVGMILVSLFAVNFSTVFFILIGAVLGISVYLVGLLRGKSESEVEK